MCRSDNHNYSTILRKFPSATQSSLHQFQMPKKKMTEFFLAINSKTNIPNAFNDFILFYVKEFTQEQNEIIQS